MDIPPLAAAAAAASSSQKGGIFFFPRNVICFFSEVGRGGAVFLDANGIVIGLYRRYTVALEIIYRYLELSGLDVGAVS